MLLDRAVEIEAQVRAAVEGIDRHICVRKFGRQRRDLREGGECQFRPGEEQVAIPALETRFGLQPDPGPREAAPRPWAERPFEPVREAGGMRAAPHPLAMRVEHQRRHIRQVIGSHRLGHAALQPLDRQTGGNLAHEAAGVGKARLDGDPSALAGIGAVALLGEKRVEKAPAMFQRALGLEQGRNIDPVLDTEQPREIERGEHGRGLLALGHQHADRRIAVDMLQDLRHRQELAHGGAALDGQAGEVGALRLRIVQQVAQRRHGTAAGQVDLGIVEFAADRVVQLLRVHAEMYPPHAEAVRAHRRGQRA